MKNIQAHTLKHTLRDIHEHTENRKFCFVIGSGASFKSGIPIGGELAQKWFEEIEERFSKTEINKWIKEAKLDKKDLAAHYGPIYRKRFESDKTSGYEFLVQAMKDAKPTFGHIVLAQILGKVPGHCVLTTNFDSLVETAIYQFTDKTPLVCGHESLSGYARPSNIHPLIIKIHRDLLLDPKSDPDEISTLDNGWKDPLDMIFSSHIPIVIGYGGNDGSLMSYFEQMNKPSNFFWCDIIASPTSSRVKSLIEKMEGSYVQIKGFDELMHDLLWVFDEIKPIKEELNEITKGRIESVDNQLNQLSEEKVKKEFSPRKAEPKKEISAFEYSRQANNEPNHDKRKEIYLEAIKKFPATDWLWSDFIYFLQFVKKDYTDLDEYYEKVLRWDYAQDINHGNYGIYLYHVKKDYVNAEKHFLSSLSFGPKEANYYANYAQLLLSTNRKSEAEKYLDAALEINGNAENDTQLELMLYRYAHFPELLDESKQEIERLLKNGIRSEGWNFTENVKVAIENGHPDPNRLKKFADKISNTSG